MQSLGLNNNYLVSLSNSPKYPENNSNQLDRGELNRWIAAHPKF
jgi:hypothetical protein